MDFFEGKEVLITGGTGSLGKTLVKLLIKEHKPKGIRIFSRGELLQWEMKSLIFQWMIETDRRVPIAFHIGDVRDVSRLRRALTNVDVCIHTAALKQVGACEENPIEAVQTNIMGAVNVINAAIDCGVERVMNVSTDKAVKPVNHYGATKMAAEKLFIHGNVYTGGHKTKFSCCRYGNVLASRGSVAHVFKDQAAKSEALTITHRDMTRFWITLPRVGRFLLDRVADMSGGEVFVPKMKSMKILDMAYAMGSENRCECKAGLHVEDILCPWCDNTFPKEIVLPQIKETGIRQGEKLHEILFHREEYAYDMNPVGDYYEIVAQERDGWVRTAGELESHTNPEGFLTRDELLTMLEETI